MDKIEILYNWNYILGKMYDMGFIDRKYTSKFKFKKEVIIGIKPSKCCDKLYIDGDIFNINELNYDVKQNIYVIVRNRELMVYYNWFWFGNNKEKWIENYVKFIEKSVDKNINNGFKFVSSDIPSDINLIYNGKR